MTTILYQNMEAGFEFTKMSAAYTASSNPSAHNSNMLNHSGIHI